MNIQVEPNNIPPPTPTIPTSTTTPTPPLSSDVGLSVFNPDEKINQPVIAGPPPIPTSTPIINQPLTQTVLSQGSINQPYINLPSDDKKPQLDNSQILLIIGGVLIIGALLYTSKN